MIKLTDDQKQADLITIGGLLNNMFRMKESRPDIELATQFINHSFGSRLLQDNKFLHTLMHSLSMKNDDSCILGFARAMPDLVYTEPIRLQNSPSAFCDVRLYDPIAENLIISRHGAWIADTFALCHDRFAVITRLESRNHGYAKKLLPDVLYHLENLPVFLQAGYLYKGEAELNLSHRINKLVKYYESHGFINVNHLYGCNQSVILYHPNGSGLSL